MAGFTRDVVTHKGIFYFPTWQDAKVYAVSIFAPTDRILSFDKGWAIQWHKSGPYVGPDAMEHGVTTRCAWCD